MCRKESQGSLGDEVLSDGPSNCHAVFVAGFPGRKRREKESGRKVGIYPNLISFVTKTIAVFAFLPAELVQEHQGS